jgi:hypothetical protein
MIRRTLLALALLPALLAPALPVSAQPAPFMTVECSQNITGVGRRAAVFERAVDSAIDAFDAEARRIHGARTAFTYRGGEALYRGGRLSLSCTRSAGMHSCEARGRTCAWATTPTPNTEVASRCNDGFTHSGSAGGGRSPCGWTERSQGRDPILRVVPPRAFQMPRCPRGYTLDGANPARCLRG